MKHLFTLFSVFFSVLLTSALPCSAHASAAKIPSSSLSSSIDFLNFNDLLENRWKGQVPFPPEALLDDLLGLDPQVRVTTVIFPHGRSLERFATLDESMPRTLFTWRRVAGPLEVSQEPDGGDGLSNTFLAYTPAKNELEIITYNSTNHEFDFKILANYGPNQKNLLVEADKSACMACHQQGQAIFPIFPWSETVQTTSESQTPLTESIMNNPNLEPFAKSLIHNTNPRIEVTPAQMDALIRISDRQFYALKSCTDACKGNAECTKMLIKASLFDRFGVCQTDQCDEFLGPLQKSLTYSESPDYFDNDQLPDREPTVDKIKFTTEEDPLRPRLRADRAEQFPGQLAFDFSKTCFPFDPNDATELQAEEKKTDQYLHSSQMTDLIEHTPGGVPSVKDILAVLHGETVQRPAIPIAAVKTPTLLIRDSCRNTGLLFGKYCSSCHAGPDSIATTLPLKDLDGLKSFVGLSNPSRTVVGLLSNPGALMPPRKAPQPTEVERQQMTDVIQGLGSCHF